MTASEQGVHATTLRDYLQVIRRRKWIVLQSLVLVPFAAVALSLHQQTLYQATARVLLSYQNLANQLTGTNSTGGISLPPDRLAATQAGLAKTPEIADAVLKRVPHAGLTRAQFLGSSSVTAATNQDFLGFAVTNHDPRLARQLVDAFTASYADYRLQLDTTSIQHALAGVDTRIKELDKAGANKSPLYSELVNREQTLQTMIALQTSNVTVIKGASGASKVQPNPRHSGILGLVLGLVLGLGLAFLWEALDTRVRRTEEIGERLGGVPLLAQVPAPSKSLRARNRLVMLDEPGGVQAETFRMLRTNLEFVTLGRGARTIMVTSAVQEEGKSTTIANLAIALARAGQRVVLVDLDLRRPFLDRFFDIEGPGITQVALGHVPLERALYPVALVDSDPRSTEAEQRRSGYSNGGGNGHTSVVKGVLEVLPSGPLPPNPGEFVGTQALGDILEQLRGRADIVLLDSPPVLQVGDAMTLSTRVDGIVLVTQSRMVRRHMLKDLARQLSAAPTPVLGYVVTGVSQEAGYGYGYGYSAVRATEKSETPGRARSEA